MVKYEPKHLLAIDLKEIHQGERPNLIMTTALTFMIEEEVVAIVGGFLFVPGVLHIWGLMSESIRKAPISFHKTVLDVLKFYEEHEKLRRIQVEVRETYLEGQRWIKSLGFHQEGIMKNYGSDGATHILFARYS